MPTLKRLVKRIFPFVACSMFASARREATAMLMNRMRSIGWERILSVCALGIDGDDAKMRTKTHALRTSKYIDIYTETESFLPSSSPMLTNKPSNSRKNETNKRHIYTQFMC